MEIPHVIVVNKEDIGMAARKTLSELKTTLGRRTDSDGWQAPALSASAALGSGIEALADALDSHRTWLLERGNSPPAASAVRRNGWSSTCARNLDVTESVDWAAKTPCSRN